MRRRRHKSSLCLKLYGQIRNGIPVQSRGFFLEADKGISLVDSLSFEIMESYDISAAFAFDHHFEKMGFTTSIAKDID